MPVAFKDSLDGILIKAGQYMEYDGLETIRKAYEFTLESNRRFDFLRMSGEPAIVHPLAVAAQLVEWRMDSETVVLHVLSGFFENAVKAVLESYGHGPSGAARGVDIILAQKRLCRILLVKNPENRIARIVHRCGLF